jgi:alpha-glucosidase (family GH31 glycosyl hydrolase)
MLVPYVRAAAAEAAATGLPIVRPLPLVDPDDERGWSIADAFGYGPSLWIAPVVDEGVTEREVLLPRGEWIETWSGRGVSGGEEVVAPAPLHSIPVWVRAGHIVVSYPATHISAGLGDTPDLERPLVATLWGEPESGSAIARLADGAEISWTRKGGWKLPKGRDVEVSKLP